jgi:ketosteroid isomerase-like protein
VTASSNLDLVRSIYADWGRGELLRVDWADPEIEFVIADGPEPGTWIGLEEMAGISRDFLSAWKDWRIVAEAYRELDDTRVLVLLRRGAHDRRSGLQLFEQGANLLQLRDGKVTRLVFYWDRDRALADLGLEA